MPAGQYRPLCIIAGSAVLAPGQAWPGCPGSRHGGARGGLQEARRRGVRRQAQGGGEGGPGPHREVSGGAEGGVNRGGGVVHLLRRLHSTSNQPKQCRKQFLVPWEPTIGQIPLPPLWRKLQNYNTEKEKFSAKEKCILEFTFKENKLKVSGSNKMGIFSQYLLVVTKQEKLNNILLQTLPVKYAHFS